MGSPYFHKIRKEPTEEEKQAEIERNRQKYLEATAKAKADRERAIRERHEREQKKSESQRKEPENEPENEPEQRAIFPRTIGGSGVPDIEKRVVDAANEADKAHRANKQSIRIPTGQEALAGSPESKQTGGNHKPGKTVIGSYLRGLFPPGLQRDIVRDWMNQGKDVRFYRSHNQWYMQVDKKHIPVDDFSRIVEKNKEDYDKTMRYVKEHVTRSQEE